MRRLVADAEDRRQMPPSAPGGQHEHDRAEDGPVIGPGYATALRALWCYRNQQFDDLPEAIGYKTFSKLIHTRAIPYALHAKTIRQDVFVALRLTGG